MKFSRRSLIKNFGLTTLAFSGLSQAQNFEDFKQQQTQGFSNYKAELEKDFQAYKDIIQEEFNKYKQQVKEVWGDEQIGDNKVFVSYDKTKNTRSIIDFEKGTMTIEHLSNDKNSALKAIQNKLIDTANSNLDQAYKQDQLLQNIEKSAEKSIKNYKTAPLPQELLVGDLITNKQSPSRSEINQAVTQKVANQSSSSVKSAPQDKMKIYSLSIPIAKAHNSPKAEKFKPLVNKYAKQEKIDPALVLAIMHSESSFNPLAKSHIPAFGLMQIVPQSAGRDASEKVYGKQRLLSPSYLYNKDNNIKMGTAYMNILYYRYLSKIKNPESRTYCMICAYNTGAGNVAKAFTGTTNINNAAHKINRMAPKDVHQHLMQNLPYPETINYLKVVLPRYQAYKV